VSAYAYKMYSIGRICKMKLGKVKDPYEQGLVIRQTKAHRDTIVSISMNQSGGLVSCSKDHKVRVWSPELDLWGTMN